MEGNKNLIKQITRYIIIISIILTFISIILPWGEIETTFSEKLNLYSFGMDVNTNIQNSSNFIFYFQSFFNEEFYRTFDNNPIFLMLATVIILFLITLLIQCINEIRNNITKKGTLTIAIWSLFPILFFYIFIQFGLLPIIESGISTVDYFFLSELLTVNYQYSTGFYLSILSTVLLFTNYFLIDIFKPKNKPKSLQNKEHMDILKNRYALGEISKDEYQEMKKELE